MRSRFSPIGGSSPLARGLHALLGTGLAVARIIPARAGFTGHQPRSSVRCSDHPRSRGVYYLLVVDRDHVVGSSPLARGLHANIDQTWERLGIIPARAGFTTEGAEGRTNSRDHPRSRGVYESSQDEDIEAARIIPARAGFTRGLTPLCRCHGDHPRSRGVYSAPSRAARAAAGSSPLARGLHLRILGIPTNPYSTRPRLPSLPT